MIVAYSPGVASDLGELIPEMQTKAMALIGLRLKAGQWLGAPVARLVDPALSGLRQVQFDTPEARAQGLGMATILWAPHPVPETKEYQRAVAHIVAVGYSTSSTQRDELRARAIQRLAPAGASFALAYSPGVNKDMEGLKAKPGLYEAAVATIRGLVSKKPAPGRDVFSGEELAIPHYPATAQVARLMYFDAPDRAPGRLPGYAVSYQLLRPPQGSKVNTVQILAVSERRTTTVLERLSVRLRVELRTQAAPPKPANTATQGRAAAAARTSTTGSKHSAASPQQPPSDRARRQAAGDRAQNRRAR